MEIGDGGLVLKVIAHAACAGGLRVAARVDRVALRGLLRAADFHSRVVARLTNELLAGLGVGTPAGRV